MNQKCEVVMTLKEVIIVRCRVSLEEK